MGIGIIVFLISFLIIYPLMKLSCIFKKKYCLAENWLCDLLNLVMCESCREACSNHQKLIVRAVLFSAMIAIASTLVHYCAR